MKGGLARRACGLRHRPIGYCSPRDRQPETVAAPRLLLLKRDDAVDVLRQVPERLAMRNSALRRAVLLLSGTVLGWPQRDVALLRPLQGAKRADEEEEERVLLGEVCRLSTCATAIQ
jgi:hypothetical protein